MVRCGFILWDGFSGAIQDNSGLNIKKNRKFEINVFNVELKEQLLHEHRTGTNKINASFHCIFEEICNKH